MAKLRLSQLLTRYWFVFLVVAAVNFIIRIVGIKLFDYAVVDWFLPLFLIGVYVAVLIKIDADSNPALRKHLTPAAMVCLRGTVWLCSFILVAMSTLSFFGMSVIDDSCGETSDRKQCRAYEAILESRNGPVKQVLFRGWAWKPCARCFERGEIHAPKLSFSRAVIARNDSETTLADVSVKTVLGASDRYLAQLVKDEPAYAQEVADSMTSKMAFACLNAVGVWRYPRQVSSVTISCNPESSPFLAGPIEVSNIRVRKK